MSTRIARPRIAILALFAVLFAAQLTSASPASAYDANCKRTTIQKEMGFNTYWLSEGVGWVPWRHSMNLSLYDRCDHGAIMGVITVNEASINIKRGTYRVGLFYKTSYSSSWLYYPLQIIDNGSYGGRRSFSVYTGGHIDLSRTSRITDVKMSSFLIFNGVGGASRNLRCNALSFRCVGSMGW